MEPNAVVSQRPDLSMSKNKEINSDWAFTTTNYLLNRKPDFYVYIFNISRESFEIARPPYIAKAIITGCPNGQKYQKVTRLPSPFVMPKASIDSGEVDFSAVDTRRIAMDIINPDNLGIDQDQVTVKPTNVGNNLGQQGVFWSLNEVPTDEEIAKARARMEKYYRYLLEKARAVEVSNPKELNEMLTPAHHAAADYFQETFTWHAKAIRKEACPRCGMPVDVNRPFHAFEGGGFCVGNWDAAIAAGVRTRAQAYEATEDPKYAPKKPVSVE
jgi:hypothetical protein